MTLLADALSTPTAVQIGMTLLSLASIMAFIKLGRDLLVRKPSIEMDFVMKSEFNEFKGAVERRVGRLEEKMDTAFLRLGDKLDDMQAEIMTAGERRGHSIHERINGLESKVARLDERTSS